MRGWMQGKVGLVVLGAVSVVLLTSCFISSSKPKSYMITGSTSLPLYSDGHYISMQYDSYSVGASPQQQNGSITMRWQQSTLPLPFGPGNRSALRFSFQEAGGTAVQYVTQDTNGSIFLQAFEGIGSAVPGTQTHTFWPNKDLILVTPNQPKSLQVFWSPIDQDVAGTATGLDHASNQALDYNIVGECDPTTCNAYGSMTALQPSQDGTRAGYFVDKATQVVSTPLGNFETYHIRYAGTLAVTNFPNTFNPSVGFDYRASCLHPGQNGTATFEGEIWVYPSIGPVKIRNYCFPSVGTSISYGAQITGTNLPF
jgi:hypothetical protein